MPDHSFYDRLKMQYTDGWTCRAEPHICNCQSGIMSMCIRCRCGVFCMLRLIPCCFLAAHGDACGHILRLDNIEADSMRLWMDFESVTVG